MAANHTISAVGVGSYSKDVTVGEVDKVNPGDIEQDIVTPESGMFVAGFDETSAVVATTIVLPIVIVLAFLFKHAHRKKQNS